MATYQATLTPVADQTPATVSTSAKELSGEQWCDRYPTSVLTDDLTPEFKGEVDKFIDAIKAAGGGVSISATYRPKERAYLMHYSYKVAKGEIAASAVPAMEGVNIEWVHDTNEKSKKAASGMVSKYGIAYAPALESRHSEKTAIDMTIAEMADKTIKDADNKDVRIKKLSDLNAVGKTYGVIKLVSDPPHWSSDGH